MEELYSCYLCGSDQHRVINIVNQKPAGETDYGISEADYARTITQCLRCDVYTNQHGLISEKMYEGYYNNQISLGSIRDRYDKVMSFPPQKSDNYHRVTRILDFLKSQHCQPKEVNVLDVGSGTCVFLGALHKSVGHCACIDPDPQAIQHASQYVGITEAHCGSLADFESDSRFDLITFNKVLEHVKDPVELLSKSLPFLKEDGLVYVELPEGEQTVELHRTAERQEFFVEHYTIFNKSSYEALAVRAGFNCLQNDLITEPSGKMTIYGFLKR